MKFWYYRAVYFPVSAPQHLVKGLLIFIIFNSSLTSAVQWGVKWKVFSVWLEKLRIIVLWGQQDSRGARTESEDTQWRGTWQMRSGVQNLVLFPLTNFCLHFIQGPRQKLLLSDRQGLPLCSLLITVTISEGKQLKRRMDVSGLYPNSTRPRLLR